MKYFRFQLRWEIVAELQTTTKTRPGPHCTYEGIELSCSDHSRHVRAARHIRWRYCDAHLHQHGYGSSLLLNEWLNPLLPSSTYNIWCDENSRSMIVAHLPGYVVGRSEDLIPTSNEPISWTGYNHCISHSSVYLGVLLTHTVVATQFSYNKSYNWLIHS